jgi:hypothetical protein
MLAGRVTASIAPVPTQTNNRDNPQVLQTDIEKAASELARLEIKTEGFGGHPASSDINRVDQALNALERRQRRFSFGRPPIRLLHQAKTKRCMMQASYVLIDFENVQPKNLDVISKHLFKVVVFVGATQTKIPVEFSASMQPLGKNGKYIESRSTKKNALDFLLSCYLGHSVARDPSAAFFIVSKDTGYDPLIKHLQTDGVRVKRVAALNKIPVTPAPRPAAPSQARPVTQPSALPAKQPAARPTAKEVRIKKIVSDLKKRGQALPKSEKALANTIGSLFRGQLDDDEPMYLVSLLQSRNYVSIEGDTVEYRLPK